MDCYASEVAYQLGLVYLSYVFELLLVKDIVLRQKLLHMLWDCPKTIPVWHKLKFDLHSDPNEGDLHL